MTKTLAPWGSIKAQIAGMERGESCTFPTRKAAANFRTAAVRLGVAVSIRAIGRVTFRATHCGPYLPRKRTSQKS